MRLPFPEFLLGNLPEYIPVLSDCTYCCLGHTTALSDPQYSWAGQVRGAEVQPACGA